MRPIDFRGFKADVAARLLAREYNRRLRPWGLTYVPYFILLLLAAGDAERPSDIAVALQLDNASISGHLDRLTAAGLVERRPDSADRRVSRLRATDTAKHLIDELDSVGRGLSLIDPNIVASEPLADGQIALRTALEAQRALDAISDAVRGVVAAVARAERVAPAEIADRQAAITPPGPAAADESAERPRSVVRPRSGAITTLRVTTLTTVRGPVGEVLSRFAGLVEERSGGSIRVSLIIPSSAPGGELQTLVDVRSGDLAIAALTLPVAGNLVLDAQLVELPYLFDDARAARAFIDGPFGRSILEQVERFGLIGLGIAENGFRSLTARAGQIRNPEDVAGLRLRVQQSPINVHLAEALGAIAVPLPFPRLADALAAGEIDAQENALANIVGLKLWRWQRSLTLSRHTFSAHIVLGNADILAALGSGEIIVREAMRDAIAEIRRDADRIDGEFCAELRRHLSVIELSPTSRTCFIEATRLVHERVARALGDDAVARAVAAAAAVRSHPTITG
ncbi:MAG: TRAP transporter substrate-binding protein DctP [Vulcanimicrobiaceae bacterium]